jgi:splicing factor 3B subunit 3
MVSSPLGFTPTGIWATKLKADDEYDAYIVLSAPNATYVLSIGESIEQVADSNFVETSRTLAVQQLGQDSVVQVHTGGFVRLRADGRREPWPEPGSAIAIAAATTNKRQIVLATRVGELVYFEVRSLLVALCPSQSRFGAQVDMEGELNEYMERKPMGAAVTTMSIAEVSEGRQRTPYLVRRNHMLYVASNERRTGCRLRGPDRPHRLAQPRELHGHAEHPSADCSAIVHLCHRDD